MSQYHDSQQPQPDDELFARWRTEINRINHMQAEESEEDADTLSEMVRAVPDEVFEQINLDIEKIGGAWHLPEEYEGAVGRTMFDLPQSEDNTITILLPRAEIATAPSQSLIRIKSVPDGRIYLGIVVRGPFAEPDGLRGDAPIMITTAVRGGIFMPRFHGRVQVELLGEQLPNGSLIPPRLRPLPNSPIFVLDSDQTATTLNLGGDIPLGVPVGYENITAAIPSDKKFVLPCHVGILGTTGGGKSTTVSGLISHFQEANMATIVIDTEGEYTQIYEPTQDPTMLSALKEREQQSLKEREQRQLSSVQHRYEPRGVKQARVYHLFGHETTCSDKQPGRIIPFTLEFAQLSPHLATEILELNDAQEQRYLKADDIARRLLYELNVFPRKGNDEDMRIWLELDDMERGYPKMTMQHMYDIVSACAKLVAGEQLTSSTADTGDTQGFRFYSPDFGKEAAKVIAALHKAKESKELPGDVRSWRVIQGRLRQIIKMKVFDNNDAKPFNYVSLTIPGRVSIIDLSDTDDPRIRNLVIAELLRGIQAAQNEHYGSTRQGEQQHRTMVIIEEAHEFLSSERIKQMPLLFQQVAQIARRGRKRWLGLVFVTQLPQHLPDEVLGLINNYILHKISDANVIGRLKRSLGVIDDGLWQRLPNLAPGQALVTMSSFARPLLINIDPTPCKLGMIE
jgi:hypothetical protein